MQAHYTKSKSEVNYYECYDCTHPASKECRNCGTPICKTCYNIMDGLCADCREAVINGE